MLKGSLIWQNTVLFPDGCLVCLWISAISLVSNLFSIVVHTDCMVSVSSLCNLNHLCGILVRRSARFRLDLTSVMFIINLYLTTSSHGHRTCIYPYLHLMAIYTPVSSHRICFTYSGYHFCYHTTEGSIFNFVISSCGNCLSFNECSCYFQPAINRKMTHKSSTLEEHALAGDLLRNIQDFSAPPPLDSTVFFVDLQAQRLSSVFQFLRILGSPVW